MITLAFLSLVLIGSISIFIIKIIQALTHPFCFQGGIEDFVLKLAAAMLVLKFGIDTDVDLSVKDAK
jgi:hypothetical protein